VPLDTDFVLTFNENVNEPAVFIEFAFGLYKTSDDSVVFEVPNASPLLDVTDNVFTMPSVGDLEPDTEYYIQIGDDYLDDDAGNFYAGIDDSTTWSFTTQGISSTGRVSYSPPNPTLEDESDTQVLSFTLDEPIIGDTQIVINLESSNSDLELSSDEITFLAAEWSDTKEVTLSLDPGFTFTENINTTITFSVTTSDEYYTDYYGVIPVLIGSAGIDAPIPIQSLFESATSPTIDTMSFSLESRPIDDVVITPISTEGEVSFSPASLTFSFENWDQAQSITSTAIDDDVSEGVHSDTVTFTVTSSDSNYDGLTLTDVPVTILDDDLETSQSGSSTAASRERAEEIFAQHHAGTKESLIKDHSKEGSTCPVSQALTQNLKQGARDGQFQSYTGATVTEVALLQQYINEILADAYESPAGPIDGMFGPLTEQGVKRMQQALLDRYGQDLGTYGIDGIVGPFTRNAINGWCEGEF
jgi:hypothetical protein